MKYLSIDLETTGLDPAKHQIIEFAAVLDDLMNPKPMAQLPRLCLYVNHENFVWSPEAYKMNRTLFEEIISGEAPAVLSGTAKVAHDHYALASYIETWLDKIGPVNAKYTCAGKNFGSFDLQFLNRYANRRWWHHRCIDPGSMYARPDDEVLPSTVECLSRAGLKSQVEHRALSDALDIVRLVRFHFGVPVE